MPRIWFFSLTIIFLSCNGIKHGEAKNTEIRLPKKGLSVFCFYKMDDKYAETTDTAEIDNWLKEKNAQIINNVIVNDLFQHNGGGPNGAEWNPGTDLYVAIYQPAQYNNTDLTIKLNDQPVNESPLIRSHIKWIVLPQRFWQKALSNIRNEDIEPLFGKKTVDEINRKEYIPAAPLKQGKIFKLTLQMAEMKQIKYFHADFGE